MVPGTRPGTAAGPQRLQSKPGGSVGGLHGPSAIFEQAGRWVVLSRTKIGAFKWGCNRPQRVQPQQGSRVPPTDTRKVPFQTHFLQFNQTLQKVQNQTLRCGLFQTLEKQNQTLERGKIRHLSEANQTHQTSKIRHMGVHNQTHGSTQSDTWEYTIRHLRVHNQTHKTSKIRHIGVQDQTHGSAKSDTWGYKIRHLRGANQTPQSSF